MEEKKDELLFGEPEFLHVKPMKEPSLCISSHLNILGLLRLLLGHVRNSSGQRDNMLMCVYLSLIIFVAGIWWATHLEVKHSLNTDNIKQSHTKNKTTPKKKGTNRIKRKSVNRVQINASAPAPLPAAYYYILFGPILLFTLAYYSRRESGKKFIINMTQAATGNPLNNGAELKNNIMGYMDKALSKYTTPTPPTDPSPTPDPSPIPKEKKEETEERGRH